MKKSLNECYKNYLGSGNVNSDLWILGFEPGGNPFGDNADDFKSLHFALQMNEQQYIKYLNSPNNDFIEGNTYSYIKKILLFFSRHSAMDLSQEHFNLNSKSDAFYTNLFPLNYPFECSEKNKIIFNRYKNYFNDLGSLSREEQYPPSVVKERSKKITKALVNPKKIIILKLPYIEYYFDLFGLEIKSATKVFSQIVKWGRGNSEWPIYKCNGHKIAFLPNGRIGNDRLKDFLKEFNKIK